MSTENKLSSYDIETLEPSMLTLSIDPNNQVEVENYINRCVERGLLREEALEHVRLMFLPQRNVKQNAKIDYYTRVLCGSPREEAATLAILEIKMTIARKLYETAHPFDLLSPGFDCQAWWRGQDAAAKNSLTPEEQLLYDRIYHDLIHNTHYNPPSKSLV